MAAKTWEDIYRTKDTVELYKIFRGHGYSTYGQKKLAQKILIERNFDFGNTQKVNKEWKQEAAIKKREFKKNYPILTFIDNNIGYITSLIFGALLLWTFSLIEMKELKETKDEYIFLLIFWICVLLGFFLIGVFKQRKINRKRKR